jgi:hypothetical protein
LQLQMHIKKTPSPEKGRKSRGTTLVRRISCMQISATT